MKNYYNEKRRNAMKNRTQQNITQRIVIAALLAAVTCVVTMIVKIPSPLKGYLNLGDCVVLTAGWMLSPMYGFLAAEPRNPPDSNNLSAVKGF